MKRKIKNHNPLDTDPNILFHKGDPVRFKASGLPPTMSLVIHCEPDIIYLETWNYRELINIVNWKMAIEEKLMDFRPN